MQEEANNIRNEQIMYSLLRDPSGRELGCKMHRIINKNCPWSYVSYERRAYSKIFIKKI